MPPMPSAEPPPTAAQALEPVPPHKPVPPHPHPPQAVAQAQPIPHPASPAVPATPASPSQSAAASASGTQASNAASQDGAGGRGRADAGAGRADAGNGSLEGPGDDYLDKVQRWVARFRKYPDDAIKQRQEGVASVGFKFARDGTVLDAWIEKSSGYPLLDNAAVAMIRAASPIPKVPDKYHGDTLTLAMPERFRIGVFDRIFH